MISDEAREYRRQITEMLATITKELSALGIHNPTNTSDWIAVPKDLDAEEPDLNLASDAVEEWNERSALVAVLESRYNDITRALEKLNTDTFGVCELCGTPIEKKRLDVNPIARTCITHREDDVTVTP